MNALFQLRRSPLSHTYTHVHLEAAVSAVWGYGAFRKRAQPWHEEAASATHSLSCPNVFIRQATF